MPRTDAVMPWARKKDLVVVDVAGEVLVYDQGRHRAHCLNRAAALVWRGCDGRTALRAMAGRLAEDGGGPPDEAVVRLALTQLSKVHLLEERSTRPAQPELTRREVMQRLGVAAAAALPLVTSITAPTEAAAASCIPFGGPCTTAADCCPTCVPASATVCAPVTHRCACD